MLYNSDQFCLNFFCKLYILRNIRKDLYIIVKCPNTPKPKITIGQNCSNTQPSEENVLIPPICIQILSQTFILFCRFLVFIFCDSLSSVILINLYVNYRLLLLHWLHFAITSSRYNTPCEWIDKVIKNISILDILETKINSKTHLTFITLNYHILKQTSQRVF